MTGKHILIVDDDINTCYLIELMLKSEFKFGGYDITVTQSSFDAIQKIRTNKFNLLIASLELPGINGMELLRIAKKICPYIEVLITTSTNNLESIAETLRLGACDYILKPIDDSQVLSLKTDSALEKQRLALENIRLLEDLKESKKNLEIINSKLETRIKEVEDANKRIAKLMDEVQNKNKELELSYQQLEIAKNEIAEWNKELEEKVRERTALLENTLNRLWAMLGGMAEGVIFCDADDRSMIINKRTEEMLNLPKDRSPDILFRECYPEDVRGKIDEIISRFKTAGETLAEFEFTHNKRYFQCSFASIRNEMQEYIGTVALLTDITDKREMEIQLIQAGKLSALGQLAAGVAHELNQPLTGIKTFAQLAMRELEGNNSIQEYLKIIEEQTNRMVKIINHLRSFSRQEETEKKEIDINTPIENSLMLIGEQLRKHQIEVVKRLTEGLPKVYADSNQLEQVLLNLIANARDAMESKGGGTLTIATFFNSQKRCVEITVSDTGTGIPKDVMNKIFDPFFTTKEVGKGTGLGLSISYGIIKNHSGYIEVESEEGIGSTFKILLPVISLDKTDEAKTEVYSSDEPLLYEEKIDELTGLLDFQCFQKHLEDELISASANNKLLSLLIIDIDHFQRVNEIYGREFGDNVLREISLIIKQNFVSGTSSARFAEKNFIMLIPNLEQEKVFEIAEQIRKSVENYKFLYTKNEIQQPTFLTVSIGIAHYSGKSQIKGKDLIDKANRALYFSKESGRNKTSVWKTE